MQVQERIVRGLPYLRRLGRDALAVLLQDVLDHERVAFAWAVGSSGTSRR